jgi:hypothetical protein
MATTPNIDPEQLKASALRLRDTVAEQAGKAAVKAVDLTEQGLEWAAPRAQKAYDTAVEHATPYLQEAAGRAQEAADRAKPYLEDIQGQVVEDYLPRVNKAAAAVTSAATAEGDLTDRARQAYEETAKALTTPTPRPKPRKRHRAAKALGWTTLGLSAAGVGYLLWKRSRPIEDPWAEEYWADLETDVPVPDSPAETAEDAADAVGDAAADAVDTAAETAGDVADAAKDTAEDAKDTAEDAAQTVKAAATRKAGRARSAAKKATGDAEEDTAGEPSGD